MIIDEAIGRLGDVKAHLAYKELIHYKDEMKATQLGIEALERLKGMWEQLDSDYFEFCISLPSETEGEK